MIEVHGHWQCRHCNYVDSCCSGELDIPPEDLAPCEPNEKRAQAGLTHLFARRNVFT